MRFSLAVIIICSGLALVTGCMGSPGGSGGDGFVGTPPISAPPAAPLPVGNPSFQITAAGGIASNPNMKMRASLGAFVQGTFAASANIQVRANLQPSHHDNPGL